MMTYIVEWLKREERALRQEAARPHTHETNLIPIMLGRRADDFREAWQTITRLKARVKELEGDLNIMRLQRDELVDAVAAILMLSDSIGVTWDSATEVARKTYRYKARAALAVARPVIREECARVADHYSNYDGGRAASAIRAME